MYFRVRSRNISLINPHVSGLPPCSITGIANVAKPMRIQKVKFDSIFIE